MHRESIAGRRSRRPTTSEPAAHARAEMVIQQQLSQRAPRCRAVEMKNTEAAEKVAALLPKIKAAATSTS